MDEHPSTLRLGVVPYVNVQPLIAHLSTTVDQVEIIAEVPRLMTPLLGAGEVDIAIVPVFALLQNPQWAMVPGVGIASDGAVASVLLVSDSPMEEISEVHLDPASMTSNGLVQVLFRHHWQRDVHFVTDPPQRPEHSLGLGHVIIGDRALQMRNDFPHVWDLGEEWKNWSGLPFVFAVWGVRPGLDPGPLASRLAQAPQHHNEDLFWQIAREQADELRLSKEALFHYLRDNLRFKLGRDEMLGLRHYLSACQGLGFGPKRMNPLRILPRRHRDQALG